MKALILALVLSFPCLYCGGTQNFGVPTNGKINDLSVNTIVLYNVTEREGVANGEYTWSKTEQFADGPIYKSTQIGSFTGKVLNGQLYLDFRSIVDSGLERLLYEMHFYGPYSSDGTVKGHMVIGNGQVPAEFNY